MAASDRPMLQIIVRVRNDNHSYMETGETEAVAFIESGAGAPLCWLPIHQVRALLAKMEALPRAPSGENAFYMPINQATAWNVGPGPEVQ